MRDYWDYRPGQHVTIIGPNGRGKTTLGLDLLGATASKNMPAFVLVSKPRDETIDKYTKSLKFKTIETYPPDPAIFRKPPGYMVRPYQSLTNLEEDEKRLHTVFRATMRGCYAKKQPTIVFADEVQELQSSLGLKKECEAFWKRGRSLDSGLWALAQRSAYNSQDMYNAPEHLFLFSDPDKRNRQRFSEIGGIDPDLVMESVERLTQYQALYLKRTGPHLCIVNP
jgi:energy-coupling factor transporter ATP-binding protein EcfA2